MAKRVLKNKRAATLLAALFWLLVWQLASLALGEALFLPAPWAVVRALAGLAQTGVFWRSVGGSLLRIGAGFFLGLACGVLLGALAFSVQAAAVLLRPLMLLVRATPVASFIILALVWLGNRNLSVFISFLMVLPVVYTGTLTGLQAAGGKLLEMATVFRVPFLRRLRAVYLPALLPALLSACELALGMCWKSGVAAEVIGLAPNSIGGQLYEAKIFLLAPEMFAWTVVVILLSWAFGRLVLALLRAGTGALAFRALPANAAEGGGLHG